MCQSQHWELTLIMVLMSPFLLAEMSASRFWNFKNDLFIFMIICITLVILFVHSYLKKKYDILKTCMSDSNNSYKLNTWEMVISNIFKSIKRTSTIIKKGSKASRKQNYLFYSFYIYFFRIKFRLKILYAYVNFFTKFKKWYMIYSFKIIKDKSIY